MPRREAAALKVAVLKGGRSLERQVSLRSGARVEDALAAGGHEVIAIDAGDDLVRQLKDARPDVAFIALHGADGEDGTVQELLEILAIPYTGPGVGACRRSMDKGAAKQELREAGIDTPDWVSFSQTAFAELGAADALDEIEDRLGFPLVVKPARGGSALGVRFAADREAVPQAIVSALSYDDRVLLEQHVDGRELAVAMLDARAAAGRRDPPARRGPLLVRGALRDRPHRVRLPGRTRRGGPDGGARRRDPDLGGPELRGLRARRPDPGRARAAGAGGERGAGTDRHLAVPDGRRGGGHDVRGALRADREPGGGAGGGAVTPAGELGPDSRSTR